MLMKYQVRLYILDKEVQFYNYLRVVANTPEEAAFEVLKDQDPEQVRHIEVGDACIVTARIGNFSQYYIYDIDMQVHPVSKVEFDFWVKNMAGNELRTLGTGAMGAILPH